MRWHTHTNHTYPVKTTVSVEGWGGGAQPKHENTRTVNFLVQFTSLQFTRTYKSQDCYSFSLTASDKMGMVVFLLTLRTCVVYKYRQTAHPVLLCERKKKRHTKKGGKTLAGIHDNQNIHCYRKCGLAKIDSPRI